MASVRAGTLLPDAVPVSALTTLLPIHIEERGGQPLLLLLQDAVLESSGNVPDASVVTESPHVTRYPQSRLAERVSGHEKKADERHPALQVLDEIIDKLDAASGRTELRGFMETAETYLRERALARRQNREHDQEIPDNVLDALDVLQEIKVGRVTFIIALNRSIKADLDNEYGPEAQDDTDAWGGDGTTVFDLSALDLSIDSPTGSAIRPGSSTQASAGITEPAETEAKEVVYASRAEQDAAEMRQRTRSELIARARRMRNVNGGILTYRDLLKAGLISDNLTGLFAKGEKTYLEIIGVAKPDGIVNGSNGNGHSGQASVRDYAETRAKASDTGLKHLEPAEEHDLLDKIHRGEEDWALAALCKGTDPEELFVQGAAQNRAKLICRPCKVRTECLADALDKGTEYGVWGGMTERERRALLRRRPDVLSWSELLTRARTTYETEIHIG